MFMLQNPYTFLIVSKYIVSNYVWWHVFGQICIPSSINRISCWEPWAHVKQAHHTISTPCSPLWGLRFAETGIHLDLRCEFASQSWCKGLSRLANLWHAPCSQPSWVFLRKVNPLDYDNTFVSWLVGQSFGNKLKLIILIFNEEASSITLYENNLNRRIYQGDRPCLHWPNFACLARPDWPWASCCVSSMVCFHYFPSFNYMVQILLLPHARGRGVGGDTRLPLHKFSSSTMEWKSSHL